MKIAIYGYGNLGKGVELAVSEHSDMALEGVFTRRDPKKIQTVFDDTKVYHSDEIYDHKKEIDIVIACGGSCNDLPVISCNLAQHFNIIDSYDRHVRAFEHIKKVEKEAVKGGKLSLVCAGWDPGLFSLQRLYAKVLFPRSVTYTFYGPGVSQGHTNAIREIPGVKDAVQYTIPVKATMENIRKGEGLKVLPEDQHIRKCYVVIEKNAEKDEIAKKIKTMPDYFDGYDTKIQFVSEKELQEHYIKYHHGGSVISKAKTGKDKENDINMEYRIRQDSNPEFTAMVLVAYARAVRKMYERGKRGCITVFDIAPTDLYNGHYKTLIEKFL